LGGRRTGFEVLNSDTAFAEAPGGENLTVGQQAGSVM